MAIKIRLKRIGRRNRPFYRVVVMDSRKRRDGAAIEELGWYNPIARDKDSNFTFKEDRMLHWLGIGAQPTDVVHSLMRRSGLALKWHLIKQGMDEDSIRKEMEKWALNRENRKKKAAAPKAAPADEPKKAETAEVEEPAAETPAEEESTSQDVTQEEDLPDQEEAPTEPSADKPEETEPSETDGDNTSESSEPEPETAAGETSDSEKQTDDTPNEEGDNQEAEDK